MENDDFIKGLKAMKRMAYNKTSITDRLETINDTYGRYNKLLPNPNKLLRQRGYDIFQETFMDTFVRGCVNTVFEAISSLEFEVVKNGASAAEVELANKTLDRLTSHNLVKQIVWSIFYGNQYLNVIWKKDKYLEIDKVLELPRDAFFYDIERKLKVMTKPGDIVGQEIEPYRLIAPTYDPSWENPYGNGLFLNCYKKVFIKNNVADFWTIFTEIHGSPGVKGTYTQAAASLMNMDMETFTNWFNDLLGKMVQHKVITHPEGTNVDLFPSGSTGSADIYGRLIDYCNTELSVLILGHEGASSSTPGKLGSEDMALSAKVDRIEAYTKFLIQHINTLLRWQHELNFPGQKHCTIRFFQLDDMEKYQAKADLLTSLSAIGFTPNEDYIETEFNIDKKYFTLNKSPQIIEAPPEAPAEKDVVKKNFIPLPIQNIRSENDDETETLEDQFADHVLTSKEFKSLKDATIETIAKYVDDAESYEELEDKLFNVYDDLNIQDKKDFVYRMMTVMNAYGYHQSEID